MVLVTALACATPSALGIFVAWAHGYLREAPRGWTTICRSGCLSLRWRNSRFALEDAVETGSTQPLKAYELKRIQAQAPSPTIRQPQMGTAGDQSGRLQAGLASPAPVALDMESAERFRSQRVPVPCALRHVALRSS